MAAAMASRDAEVGSCSTTASWLTTSTRADATPGTAVSSRSIVVAHEPHVMPVTGRRVVRFIVEPVGTVEESMLAPPFGHEHNPPPQGWVVGESPTSSPRHDRACRPPRSGVSPNTAHLRITMACSGLFVGCGQLAGFGRFGGGDR